MFKIVISSGHSKKVRGAAGSPRPPMLEEVDEARRVVNTVAEYLRAAGVGVTTFHDDVSSSQSENLTRITDFHNAQTRDLDVSVHFNCYDGSAHGTEVLYVTQEALAKKVSNAISVAGGFTNRGPKKRTDLKFLNATEEPSILIETCFVDSKLDADLYRQNYEAICAAIASAIAGEEVAPGPTPPTTEPPPVDPVTPPAGGDEYATLKKGDEGADVVVLQRALGVLEPDGDFGSITDTWVRAFQGAENLTPDGIVGPKTWDAVDDLQERVNEGKPPLPAELAAEIYTAAQTSEIADFSWPDRGVAPPGYIAGMSLCFAHAMMRLQDGDDAATLMSQAAGDPAKDALAFYKDEFAKLGMSNKTEGVECLRHLFVMMVSLGPRESSGRYFEGRDLSAGSSSMSSDTCEAGLFQTSWNIRNGSSVIGPLLPEFLDNPNGFLKEFREGLSPTASNLDSYGSGDGLRFQFLSRFCPLFHVLVTGCGLRVLKDHWGPIKRKEILLKKETDTLLKEVQTMVEAVA